MNISKNLKYFFILPGILSLAAVILFWFSTSLIKGFALVFGLGVLVSMLTAISVSRTFLLSLDMQAKGGFTRFLFGSGTSN